MKAPSLNRWTQCQRARSITKIGTKHPGHGAHVDPPPQPNLNVSISARAEDFRRHGHTLREETYNLATTAMADTGCQSCLAGPTLLANLQLTATDLIPVNLTMHSASGTNHGCSPPAASTTLETRQMVYFSATAKLSLATWDSSPGTSPSA